MSYQMSTKSSQEQSAGETLAQMMGLPAVVVNAQGKVELFNAAAETLTGRAATAVVGKKVWHAFFDAKRATPVDRALRQPGESTVERLEVTHAETGETRAVEAKVISVLGPLGEVERVLLTMTELASSGDDGELRAELEGLRARNAEREEELEELGETLRRQSDELESLRLDLTERGKELTCIHSLGEIVGRGDASLDELIADAVELLPPAWLYPEITQGRIVCNDIDARSEGYRSSKWSLVSPIVEGGQEIGFVEVVYLEERPERDEGPFLGEERELIDTIAARLSEMVHRHFQADEAERAMVELERLVNAGVAGQLSTRGEEDSFSGNYATLIGKVNELLDAIVAPLNVAAERVESISRGVIPKLIDQQYQGDFNRLKDNVNACIRAMHGLEEIAEVVARMAVNDHTRRVEGNYPGVFGKAGEAVNGVRERLHHITETAERIAAGDLSDLEAYRALGNGTGRRSDQDRIAPAITAMMESIKFTVDQTTALSRAAEEGRLHQRAELGRLQGDFRAVVEGFNATLDAVLGPIDAAAKALENLSNFDLTARVEGIFRGDHEAIKRSVNETASVLDDAIAQVTDAVLQVRAASSQIAKSSQDVAAGSTQQASALEQTASSLEQMASMTRQNADNTNAAKGLAGETSTAAEQGAKAMTRMLEAMESIKSGAEATADIIRDINEIAFQTNLLALNAAVEAARAGDAGRGFAVVAEEVRNLAGRAKEAASKTENLIKQSVVLAENGRSISTDVGGHLDEITRSIEKVNVLIADIALASEEQARGIDEVNRAMTEMEKTVQATAANSEESSSAAQELNAQADELSMLVERFTISDH
jgi:PAS domain S-box-containing protein